MKDRSKVLFGLVMLLMVVGIIGFSYALFTTKAEKKGALNIVAGDVSCPIQSSDLENNQITLQAKEEKEITVTLTNQSLIDIHSMITYSGSSNIEVLAASSNESEIELQSLAKGTTLTYTLKLKNNGTSSEVVTLNGRCGLSNKDLTLNEGETQITGTYEKSTEYKDPSGANAPKLVTGMIPVVYDEVDKRWEKAGSSDWYDYTQQKWANAVTVTDTKRSNYMTAEAGEKIEEADINTMWVWIPRYEYDSVSIASYAGGTSAKPGAINIKFISKEVTEADEDNYKVHPAFTFGTEQLDGFWYGKFETSNQEGTYEVDSSTLTPIIKPNTTSWRNVKVVNMFYAALNMTTEENATEYGFSSDGSIDTHMSKNSEWGAVAYLSQSKYGKYGNDTYGEDDKEVYINNCKNYITGIAGATASAKSDSACTNTYNTEAGQKASTTGNITGVYDMSGGAWEYVMGALNNGSGKPTIGSSGFVDGGSDSNKLPDAKYYDVYTTNLATSCTTNGECYGHALSETSGWYSDTHSFVTSTYPWFRRGGGYDFSSNAGVFASNYNFGYALSYASFRLVLVRTEV